MRFIDIGANLTDGMFQGIYNEKRCHEADLAHVLRRAHEAGVEKIIVTGGSLQECREALKLIEDLESNSPVALYATVGVHPTRCQEFERDGSGGAAAHVLALQQVIRSGGAKVVAVGECGLDYDRLHFCPRHLQLKYFEMQFQLAEASNLPLFLHNRNTRPDFTDVVSRNRDRFGSGVAHCFTGDLNEMRALVDLNLSIGITGCSVKTQDSLDVMQQIPDENLLLETDAPWCDIRPTHAGFKAVKTQWGAVKKEKFEAGRCTKSRNEPCNIRQVAEVVAAHRGMDLEQLVELVYSNAQRMFFPAQ